MAERALRGTSIGSKSLESEEGVTFAARKVATYRLPNGETFEVTFAAEANPPAEWESKSGETAQLVGDAAEEDDDKAVKPQRTHWDMLLERRSEAELAQLLEEQLELLHQGKLREGPHYRMR
ncbi:RNA polymerase-binding protein RbpA [Nanchangia anserum]|uniref:RNA polymerase-binding protein RbpA n=1 Tax=Nanchangia anserum TaxID=2692125 RepID=A0A8I0GEX7_9ACTO|nr:RNA polymerase-binding protein RbpA [Nanchangia anserum]MBD3688804.1 RNA polymerase-binding protein RbpA [Nanchangia anserum]QOX81084.1 RNA polymerase-binding protein RbpA [Nanchangia anserum]